MITSTLSWVMVALALLATSCTVVVNGFLLSTSSSPPYYSRIGRIRDVCVLVQSAENDNDFADTTDWKAWYEAEAAKVSQLKHDIEKKLEPFQFQLDKMVGKFEIAVEEKKVVETLLKQSQREVGDLEARLQQNRQRHAEELRDLVEDLDRLQINNEIDAKAAATTLHTVKELHDMEIANLKHEFETASNALNAEWSQKLFQEQTNVCNLQAQHRATVRVAERAKDRVVVLEQEKRSLRKLSRNGLRLIRERIVRTIQKLTGQWTSTTTTTTHTTPAATTVRPAIQKSAYERISRGKKLTSAVVRYEEEFEDAFQ